jgi:mono/diheme cytochrome c family protein
MKTLAVVFAFTLSLPALAEEAKEVFNHNCAKCHGEDGKGETKMGKKGHAPNFTRERWQKRHGDDVIVKAITEGVEEHGKRRMPPFKEKLSAEQIQALVPVVRGFAAAGSGEAAEAPKADAPPAPADKPAEAPAAPAEGAGSGSGQ